MSESVRVLVVDDHKMFADALVALLEVEDGVEVIGAVGSGEEALDVCGPGRPDVVLMDIDLPGMDGIQATRGVLRICPHAKVVGISAMRDPRLLARVIAAGASGFVPKTRAAATALDVWFSGPGWTSTKSGSIKPPSTFLSHNNLGTFNMDLTAICPMVDNLSTGSATCKNGLPSTDAVQAGVVTASPMSMQAILDYAATNPVPFNGTSWFGTNRTKQEILKNIFDQFNNQLAFGSF